MGLPRDQRQAPGDLLRYVRDTIDRLQETSPLLPAIVITEYKKKFEKITDISHPAEANGLEKISVYVENPMRLVKPESLERMETLGVPETPRNDIQQPSQVS
jgi:uncharacterized membrane-anchored protein